jgi:hypothetical protein
MAARERRLALEAKHATNGAVPQLTQRALRTTVLSVLEALHLAPASHRHSTAYFDYVALEFACFVEDAAVRAVRRHFGELCERHGWEVCRINAHHGGNAIIVTLQKCDVLSTSDQRMPL